MQFRVTFIARLGRGIRRGPAVKHLVLRLTEKRLLPGGVLRWLAVPTEGGQEVYLKFSTLVSQDRLDDAWNLKTSRRFLGAGYGDLAWKITPVADGDAAGADTTSSLPLDFFQDLDGEEEASPPLVPPALFGSDLFWRWIEAVDDRMADLEVTVKGLDALEATLGEIKQQPGLRIMCAACGKMRNAEGQWRHVAAALGDRPEAELSHGICPECAKALYPDLYQDDV